MEFKQIKTSNKLTLLLIFILIFGCNFFSFSQNSDKTQAKTNLLKKGIDEYLSGDLEQAEAIFEKVLQVSAQENDTLMQIQAYVNLGNVYADKGSNTDALVRYHKALKLSEIVKNSEKTAQIKKNIGALYVSWKKFPEALAYYEQALQTAFLLKNEHLTADCYNNIGIVYEQQEKYNEALLVYGKALDFYEKAGLKAGVAMTESNLAIVYKLQKKYSLSLEHNLKALRISEEINDKFTTASLYNNIGNLYSETGNYNQAVHYAEKGLRLAQEMNAQEIIVMAYETLAYSAEKSGNYHEAYKRHKQYAEAKDLFINTENTKHFQDLQLKYKTEKKEKDLAEIQLKLARQETASKQKNILLLLSVSIIIISFVLLRNRQIKIRLQHEKNKAEIQRQRLDISRELHDNLGSQLTFMSSLATHHKVDTLSELADKAVIELRDTIWVLNSKELTLNELKLKMLNFIKNAGEAADTIQFDFSFECTTDSRLTSKQTANIYRVFQEIVNNAIKHSGADLVTVKITRIENKLHLNIKDNGNGFDFESKKKQSFGLTNIQNRINELGGSLNVTNTNGTAYHITVDLS